MEEAQSRVRRLIADIDAVDTTIRVMASRSLNDSDVMFVRTMQKRGGAALRQLREKGRVRSEALRGGPAAWRLQT